MTDIAHLIQVVQDQEELVFALEDQRVTDHAKRIAYYNAMIDAAVEDQLDDSDEQDAMLKYLNGEKTKLMDRYMELVNENM